MSTFLISVATILSSLSPLLLALEVQANDPWVLSACEAQLSAKFPRWRVVPLSSDLQEFATRTNVNPTTIWGDFDDDNRRDVAVLFVDGTEPDPTYPPRLGSVHLGVCLNTATAVRLYLIDNPYCVDGIAVSPKGREYNDFEKQVRGTYERDGVHAYCFEKSGATYQFENGAFRQIVDSD